MSLLESAGQSHLRRMWRLSWPAIIEQILAIMVSYADTAMVGVLGAAESVIGVRRAALTYKGSQCRHSEQGDVLIPKHAVAYLEKLELYVSER